MVKQLNVCSVCQATFSTSQIVWKEVTGTGEKPYRGKRAEKIVLFYECLKQFFFSFIIQKMILFMGFAVSPPPPHIPSSWAQNGSSANCREELIYVKIKVWSKVIAHELKNNEFLGHPVLVFADVLVTKKSNKCFSRWISKV